MDYISNALEALKKTKQSALQEATSDPLQKEIDRVMKKYPTYAEFDHYLAQNSSNAFKAYRYLLEKIKRKSGYDYKNSPKYVPEWIVRDVMDGSAIQMMRDDDMWVEGAEYTYDEFCEKILNKYDGVTEKELHRLADAFHRIVENTSGEKSDIIPDYVQKEIRNWYTLI